MPWLLQAQHSHEKISLSFGPNLWWTRPSLSKKVNGEDIQTIPQNGFRIYLDDMTKIKAILYIQPPQD